MTTAIIAIVGGVALGAGIFLWGVWHGAAYATHEYIKRDIAAMRVRRMSAVLAKSADDGDSVTRADEMAGETRE